MNATDFPKFKSLMNGMSRMYGQDSDGAVLDAYWLALRDWSLKDFEDAAALLMRTAKFMPRPSEFHELRKANEPTAGEAWTKVLETIRTMNPREGARIDDRTDRVIGAMGGYGNLAMANSESLPFRAKEFAGLWEEMGKAWAALPSASGNRLNGPQRAINFAISVRNPSVDEFQRNGAGRK